MNERKKKKITNELLKQVCFGCYLRSGARTVLSLQMLSCDRLSLLSLTALLECLGGDIIFWLLNTVQTNFCQELNNTRKDALSCIH